MLAIVPDAASAPPVTEPARPATSRERAAAAERWAEKERRAARRRDDDGHLDLRLEASAREQHRPSAQDDRSRSARRTLPESEPRWDVRSRREGRPRSAAGLFGQPDRVAAWAVGMGLVLLLLAATTSRAATGFAHVDLGARPLHSGMSGRDVRELQRVLRMAPVTGFFGSKTRDRVKSFERHAGLRADGVVGPDVRAALVRYKMRAYGASYFGPGLFGQHTACGEILSHRLLGVAHRTLPCGSVVTLAYGDRFITVRVVDRGPYVHGRDFDLTWATAQALAYASADPVAATY